MLYSISNETMQSYRDYNQCGGVNYNSLKEYLNRCSFKFDCFNKYHMIRSLEIGFFLFFKKVKSAMEEDECIYYELKMNSNICRYFRGNINNPRDIECCRNHCSLLQDKELMQDGIQPLVRRHGALKPKERYGK
jgi:hypothetical protein